MIEERMTLTVYQIKKYHYSQGSSFLNEEASMHADVKRFFEWIDDPRISKRRLQRLIRKIEGNSFGPDPVPNREFRKVLNAIKARRPEILAKEELTSYYHEV